MSDARSLGDAVFNAASTIIERLAAYLPSIVAAVLLVVVGWVLARVMRAVVIRTSLQIDTMLPRLGLPAGAARLRVAKGSVVAGTVVYWLVLLLFITAATQLLGLQAFTD